MATCSLQLIRINIPIKAPQQSYLKLYILCTIKYQETYDLFDLFQDYSECWFEKHLEQQHLAVCCSRWGDLKVDEYMGEVHQLVFESLPQWLQLKGRNSQGKHMTSLTHTGTHQERFKSSAGLMTLGNRSRSFCCISQSKYWVVMSSD